MPTLFKDTIDPRTVDPINLEIVAKAMKARQDGNGKPRVGDWVRFADGTEGRISCRHWSPDVQWSWGGSFHLYDSGNFDFSGSLEPSFPLSNLEPTSEVKDGLIWIFNRGHAEANAGVYFQVPLAVWKCVSGMRPTEEKRKRDQTINQ